MIYDIIIIGKGPAGISAALYTARANLRTLILGNSTGALENAEKVDNFYGFPGGVSGKELQKRGEEHAKLLGCDVACDEVLSISKEQNFLIKTDHGLFEGKQVLIAAGKSRNRSKISGLDSFLGRGVSMCAVCDGFFYRGKPLAVLGHANYAISEASELTRFASAVTICTNGRDPVWTLPIPESVLVDKRPVAEITGDKAVSGLRFEDGGLLVANGVFVAEGTASALDFAVKLGILVNGNDIIVDENYRTNFDGVYAAGDCIGGFLQISKAVADGALAARAMIKAAPKG